jgi:ferritin-like metal-binding protein YciE
MPAVIELIEGAASVPSFNLGLFMNDLHKLFLSELNSIYDGEQQLVDGLQELEQTSTSPELKDAFRNHLEQTKNHATRIEQAFHDLDKAPTHKRCHGIEGILHEGRTVAADFEDEPALDALLIASAQKAEHYEITTYGTLCTWAKELGHKRALELLKQNLKEEKEADIKLSELAESSQNAKARQTHSNTGHGRRPSSALKLAFVRELREMLDAEHLLISTLAEVAYYADSPIVKFAARHHRSQTKKHAERLQRVFSEIGEIADRKPCEGIEGIIDDAQVAVEEFLGNPALDAAMIAAAQKAEHYEITTYGTLCTWAKELGQGTALSLLKDNLSDEKQTDHLLSLAAELLLNPKAKRHESVKRSFEMAEFVKTATHAG